jgi:hypothetical protein
MTMNVELMRILHTLDASVEAYVCGTHQRIISPQKKQQAQRRGSRCHLDCQAIN